MISRVLQESTTQHTLGVIKLWVIFFEATLENKHLLQAVS